MSLEILHASSLLDETLRYGVPTTWLPTGDSADHPALPNPLAETGNYLFGDKIRFSPLLHSGYDAKRVYVGGSSVVRNGNMEWLGMEAVGGTNGLVYTFEVKLDREPNKREHFSMDFYTTGHNGNTVVMSIQGDGPIVPTANSLYVSDPLTQSQVQKLELVVEGEMITIYMRGRKVDTTPFPIGNKSMRIGIGNHTYGNNRYCHLYLKNMVLAKMSSSTKEKTLGNVRVSRELVDTVNGVEHGALDPLNGNSPFDNINLLITETPIFVKFKPVILNPEEVILGSSIICAASDSSSSSTYRAEVRNGEDILKTVDTTVDNVVRINEIATITGLGTEPADYAGIEVKLQSIEV